MTVTYRLVTVSYRSVTVSSWNDHVMMKQISPKTLSLLGDITDTQNSSATVQYTNVASCILTKL
jgi:hypothetical protein